ncbi:uncharacterized protein [Notamacropus eugenii]|uniref:uncharacterized protein n=1 Tax=Notamacropus eugenii TaxID=9315 RepID=UPI003B66BD9E
MVSQAKNPGALLKAEDHQPLLEHWIQKKGQSPWQPGYFKTENPAATASEAYTKFCTEGKPSRGERDASAAWALWQACLDSTELLVQSREECIAWQAKGLELECQCEQLKQEKQSLEDAWAAEKLLRGLGEHTPEELSKQVELQERCRQLEVEKVQWEAQNQELQAHVISMKQELELGQNHLAVLLKTNQENQEMYLNLQESYAQSQAEVQRLQEQASRQEAAASAETKEEPEFEAEPGPAGAARSGKGAAGEPKFEFLRPWEPQRRAAEPPSPEEGISGPLSGPPRGQPALPWRCPPSWKRICRGCGAWERSEKKGGAWDCPECRTAPQPWRGASSPHEEHSFPGRGQAAAGAFPMRALGMPEPSRGWGPWRGPPSRGSTRGRRTAGSLPTPEPWVCQQCQASNYAHRIGCYKCHSLRGSDFTPEKEPAFHQA